MKKCYSHDEEDFSCDSVEEAAELAWDRNEENKIGDVITLWEGEAVPLSASRFTPPMADYLTERAYEEHGEYAEAWKFSKEEEKSLQDAVDALVDEWATKNNMHPRFYKVTNVQPFQIRFTDEDGGCEVVSENTEEKP